MDKYKTAEEIINRAAVEVGLGTSSDIFASTDHSFIQLRTLLTSCGLDLVYLFPWEKLKQEMTITTLGVAGSVYDLPDGWAYMLPQTMYDRTNANPIGGPLSPQEWQFKQAIQVGTDTVFITFRLMGGGLQLFPDTTAGISIALEYISRRWVDPTTGADNTDVVEANDDVILIDDVLMVACLKAKFLAARGFDTTKADAEYSRIFNALTGQDASAAILNRGRPRMNIRYIGVDNAPDTGYGS